MITVFVKPPTSDFRIINYRDWLVEHVGPYCRDRSLQGDGWHGENWFFDWDWVDYTPGPSRVKVCLPDEKTATLFLLRWA